MNFHFAKQLQLFEDPLNQLYNEIVNVLIPYAQNNGAYLNTLLCKSLGENPLEKEVPIKEVLYYLQHASETCQTIVRLLKENSVKEQQDTLEKAFECSNVNPELYQELFNMFQKYIPDTTVKIIIVAQVQFFLHVEILPCYVNWNSIMKKIESKLAANFSAQQKN